MKIFLKFFLKLFGKARSYFRSKLFIKAAVYFRTRICSHPRHT